MRRAPPAAGRRGTGWSSPRRLIWGLSLPILFAEVGETIIHLVNTAFLGRVGTTELGAVALADSVLELWIVPAIGIVEGLQIVIARRAGEGRDRAVGDAFNLGLVLVVGLSLALTVALKGGASGLTARFLEGDQLAGAVDGFLQVAVWGLVFSSASLACSALYVAIGQTRILVQATVVLALTHILFDYALIFGHFGLPRLGIEGAALGSVGAEAVTFLFLAVATWRRLDAARYGLFRRPSANGRLARSLLRLSGPVALAGLVEGLGWVAFFLMIEQLGEQALAWSNVVYACYAVFLIPAIAFSEAGSSMVGRLVGEGREGGIPALLGRISSPAYLVTAPLVALAVLVPELVLAPFSSDAELVSGATGPLRVVAIGMLVAIPAEVWFAALFGTGDTVAAFFIEVVATGVMVGSAYLAGMIWDLPLAAVWAGLPLAGVVTLLACAAWLRTAGWTPQEV